MPILFGTLFPTAEAFSYELQRKGFPALDGELRVWWVVFRNVQVDLQINALTINKAKYLCVQEWEILTNVYNTAKEYYKTSIADLLKQNFTATFSAYSAAQPLVTDDKTKQYLISKNINENDVNQSLIRFLISLDVHFSQLARISPIGKLLREYRQRIGAVIPLYDIQTDMEPPTYGVEPIVTTDFGSIELNYDYETLYVNENNALAVRNDKSAKFDIPLYKDSIDVVHLAFDSNSLKVNAQNQLEVIPTTPLKFSEPLNLNENTVNLQIEPTTLKVNSSNQLEVIQKVDNVGAPLDVVDKTIYLKLDPSTLYNNSNNALSVVQHTYDAPINKSGNTIRLAIDSSLGVDSSGFLYVKPLTYNEPLRLTNNTEVSLGYEAPLYQNTNQNLGVKIDGKTIILNANNELESVAPVPTPLEFHSPLNQSGEDITLEFESPLNLDGSHLALNYGSPLYMNPQNQLTLNYTPVFGLNDQQQLQLNLSKPLILDSNGDLSLDYSGGITMLNSKLQLNLTPPFSVNNRQELQFDYDDNVFEIDENGKFAYIIKTDYLGGGSDLSVAIDSMPLVNYTANNGLALPYWPDDFYIETSTTGVQFLTVSGPLKTKIENGNNIAQKLNSLSLQDLTTINNRLTEIEEESPCTDTIYHEDIYRFRNKIESGSYVRHDDILTGIPAGTKIVNVKGRFVIQHEGGNFRFCAIKLDQLQDFSFVTHPINNYYATYTSYFNDTQSYPVILRIYVENGVLKYNVYSENISDDGYNIFIEYQVIECDSQENTRRTWKLIKGNVHMSATEWLYFFPSYFRLPATTTINISWDYGGESFTSGNFATQYGTPVVLYLNNKSGDQFTFKIKNSSSFTLKSANNAVIRNLTINKVS